MENRIGDSLPRVDSPEKIGGYATYIADLKFDGMLHAKTLRSKRPRARIKKISLPDIPKGYFTVDKDDVPGKNRVRMLVDDQPFFADGVVNYTGEPILLVVGPERETINRIIEDIRVDYEDIPPIFTVDDALNLQKSPIYGNENKFAEYEILKGDPKRAFKNAKHVFEKEYRTGLQEHIYLEPQGMVGTFENGRVTVYGSMQCPYYVKAALVQALGLEEDKVRVVQTTTGGAFGGKEDYPSIIAGHVAFAALKTKKPVRLIFDREEDIRSTTKRHPSIIKISTALDRDYRIEAIDIDIKLDGGAYCGLSPVVLQRAMFVATGVYNIPNVRIRGMVLATNNVPSGALRGFGGPQAHFAIEMHMHSLAEHLKENPLDFKRKYILKTADSTVTGGKLHGEVKLPEMLDLLEKISGYREKSDSFRKRSSREFRGIGLSIFLHGCAFTGSGERDKIKAKVSLKKREDSEIAILVSNADMGQGPKTTLRKIVAETLGVPLDKIRYDNPDTDKVPDSGPTVASRTVMIVGNLLRKAAEKLKNKLKSEGEFEVIEKYKQPPYVEWDQEKLTGDAYPVYSWGANAVEVSVDPITYEVKLRGVWGVYDVGTPIDENIVFGQIDGGISQGLGYATIELMQSRDGNLMQGCLMDYIIPTSMDFPDCQKRLIENPYDYGPFGAKCAGELPFIGIAPAVCAAVQAATGAQINRLPVTPELLLEVVEGGD